MVMVKASFRISEDGQSMTDFVLGKDMVEASNRVKLATRRYAKHGIKVHADTVSYSSHTVNPFTALATSCE